MIISLNWIKDYVNLDGIEVDELVKRFGLSTAEVEGVEYKGKNIENVVVAEILSVENHPESKKLHILKVNDGTNEPVQVVCGAPNVRVGLKTYFARVGGNVNGLKIKPCIPNEWEKVTLNRKFRGVNYKITIDNTAKCGNNVKEILLNGKKIDENLAILCEEDAEIIVIMG